MYHRYLAAIALFTIKSAICIPTYFNLTSITASNNVSAFQCWQLTTALASSSQDGYTGSSVQQLGGLGAGASYIYIPANLPGSAHVAPAVQFVVVLSGTLNITIPDRGEQTTVTGGVNSVIIAADTADLSTVGHITGTLDEPVAALQLPIDGGQIPPYRVLYDGACKSGELNFV